MPRLHSRGRASQTVASQAEPGTQVATQRVLLVRRQWHADEFLVVAGEDALVGKRRVRPDDVAAAGRVIRLDQLGPIDLVVTARADLGQDEFTLIVTDHEAIAVAERNEEAVAAIHTLHLRLAASVLGRRIVDALGWLLFRRQFLTRHRRLEPPLRL